MVAVRPQMVWGLQVFLNGVHPLCTSLCCIFVCDIVCIFLIQPLQVCRKNESMFLKEVDRVYQPKNRGNPQDNQDEKREDSNETASSVSFKKDKFGRGRGRSFLGTTVKNSSVGLKI